MMLNWLQNFVLVLTQIFINMTDASAASNSYYTAAGNINVTIKETKLIKIKAVDGSSAASTAGGPPRRAASRRRRLAARIFLTGSADGYSPLPIIGCGFLLNSIEI